MLLHAYFVKRSQKGGIFQPFGEHQNARACLKYPLHVKKELECYMAEKKSLKRGL